MRDRVTQIVHSESVRRLQQVKLVRRASLALQGFVQRDGILFGSALSFESILAIVPLLALGVATLKGMGSYSLLKRDIIDPWLQRTFHSGSGELSTLGDAFARIVELVDTAEVGSLGAAGLIALLYIVWTLLRSVEHVLNGVFGAHKPRSLVRALVDYAAILFIAPMGALLLSAVATQVGRLRNAGVPADWLIHIASVGLATLVAALLFTVMPSRRPRLRGALGGGLIAGLVAYLAFLLQVIAQLGVARYNALYSGFAAVPLFLLWVFIAWVGLLIGAEFAAVTSDETDYRTRMRPAEASPELLEAVALQAVVLIARCQRAGEDPPRQDWLARRCGVPLETLGTTMTLLKRSHIVFQGEIDEEVAYSLSSDPTHTSVADILQALRHSGEKPAAAAAPSDPAAAQLMQASREALGREPFTWTIHQLLDRFPDDAS